jgi:DNA-binding response OmpR family regulator
MTSRLSACVLIVEDNADSGRLIFKALAENGFHPVIAKTLDEAFRVLGNFPFCVLLDLGLPDGNGVEILRFVRRMQLPIKVAVVTGSAEFSSVGFAALLQPEAIFRKPVSPFELMKWVVSVSPDPARSGFQPCPHGPGAPT